MFCYRTKGSYIYRDIFCFYELCIYRIFFISQCLGMILIKFLDSGLLEEHWGFCIFHRRLGFIAYTILHYTFWGVFPVLGVVSGLAGKMF